MKTIFLSFGLLAAILLSVPVSAQKAQTTKAPAERPAMRQQANNEGRFQNLLTADQKETVKQIHLKSAKEMKPLQDQLRELMARHRTLATAEKPDMNAINTNIEKMGAVKISIAKAQALQNQEVRKIMTEEQRLKWDASGGQQMHRRQGQMNGYGRNRNRHFQPE